MGAKRLQATVASSSESEEEEENRNPPSKKLATAGPNAAAASSSSSDSESEEEPNPNPPSKRPPPKKPTASPAPASFPDQDSSDSDGSDEECEDEDKENPSAKQPTKPKQQEAAAAAGKRPEKSESEFESESSESGSDSDSPIKEPKPKSRPIRGPDPTIKPITSKPMEDSPKPKKPPPTKASAATPSPLSSPAKPSSKRATEMNGKDSKRKRGALSDNEEEDAGKKSFVRVWSEEDEIVFLKCIVEGMKKGSRRVDDVGALYEAVKDSINFDVSRGQIANKIRTLKKKYNNTVLNARKSGKEPAFTKPHDKEVFDLSNKIWGNHAEENYDGNADGKQKKRRKAKPVAEEIASPLKAIPEAEKPVGTEKPVLAVEKPAVAAEKPVVVVEKPAVAAEKPEVGPTAEGESCRYPLIVEALNCSQNFWLNSLSKVEVRRALALVPGSKASELELKWRKLHMLQLEAIKMHSGLIQELVDLLRDALMAEDGHALTG